MLFMRQISINKSRRCLNFFFLDFRLKFIMIIRVMLVLQNLRHLALSFLHKKQIRKNRIIFGIKNYFVKNHVRIDNIKNIFSKKKT